MRVRVGLRVIVDPIGSAVTDIAGAFTTADPTGASWPDPQECDLIRFIPQRSRDLATYNTLYETLRDGLLVAGRYSRVTVLCDEAETVMPENRCPEAAAEFVYAGRKWGTGHFACSTRPRKISTALRANQTNAALFYLPKKEDRDTIAADLGIPLTQLEALWNQLPPKMAFLWWTEEERSLQPVHLQLA